MQPPSGERQITWRLGSSSAVQPTFQGPDGERAPELEQNLTFSPLPTDFWAGAGDPFDLAWLTELPSDLTF